MCGHVTTPPTPTINHQLLHQPIHQSYAAIFHLLFLQLQLCGSSSPQGHCVVRLQPVLNTPILGPSSTLPASPEECQGMYNRAQLEGRCFDPGVCLSLAHQPTRQGKSFDSRRRDEKIFHYLPQSARVRSRHNRAVIATKEVDFVVSLTVSKWVWQKTFQRWMTACRLWVSCRMRTVFGNYSSPGSTKDFRYARLQIEAGGEPSRRWIAAVKQRRLNVSTTRISTAAQQETCDAGKTAKAAVLRTKTETLTKN